MDLKLHIWGGHLTVNIPIWVIFHAIFLLLSIGSVLMLYPIHQFMCVISLGSGFIIHGIALCFISVEFFSLKNGVLAIKKWHPLFIFVGIFPAMAAVFDSYEVEIELSQVKSLRVSHLVKEDWFFGTNQIILKFVHKNKNTRYIRTMSVESGLACMDFLHKKLREFPNFRLYDRYFDVELCGDHLISHRTRRVRASKNPPWKSCQKCLGIEKSRGLLSLWAFWAKSNDHGDLHSHTEKHRVSLTICHGLENPFYWANPVLIFGALGVILLWQYFLTAILGISVLILTWIAVCHPSSLVQFKCDLITGDCIITRQFLFTKSVDVIPMKEITGIRIDLGRVSGTTEMFADMVIETKDRDIRPFTTLSFGRAVPLVTSYLFLHSLMCVTVEKERLKTGLKCIDQYHRIPTDLKKLIVSKIQPAKILFPDFVS